jgi:hypothetical protein
MQPANQRSRIEMSTDDAIKKYLSHGGKVTKVPTGKRVLPRDWKTNKRSAKVRRAAAPTEADEAATSDYQPRPNSQTDDERLEAEAVDDDRPYRTTHTTRRRGDSTGHKQHDRAFGKKGQKPVIFTTPLGDHIAGNDDEHDRLLPGRYKRTLAGERGPWAKELLEEKIRKELRREKRNAKLEAVMARTKVGADPTGIMAIKRNMEVLEFRGKDYCRSMPSDTLDKLIPRAKDPPTRGHKRQTGHSHRTPKGSTNFEVKKIDRRRTQVARMTREIVTRHQRGESGAIIGRLLLRLRSYLDHGQFLPWVRKLGLTIRTADRYIKAAKGKLDTA